jgi:putative ABC transport system permease protein
LRPTWTPPGLTREVPILIDLEPERMLYSFLFLIILCWISSFIPARQAACQNVVDALGHA